MLRADEEPEEPETEPEPSSSTTSPAVVVAAPSSQGVAFDYRTEVLTAKEVLDGTTLPDKLARESAEGWDLVDLIQAENRHVIILRKPKKPDRSERRVGFFTR
jgi:hypothetical protein